MGKRLQAQVSERNVACDLKLFDKIMATIWAMYENPNVATTVHDIV